MDFLGIATQHTIVRFTKLGPTLISNWMKQLSKRKGVLGAGERDRDIPIAFVLSPHGPNSDSFRFHDCCFSLSALLCWFCGICFPDVFKTLGSYNPSSPSHAGFPEIYLMVGCGSLHLLLSVAGGIISDDNWARFWSMITAENAFLQKMNIFSCRKPTKLVSISAFLCWTTR